MNERIAGPDRDSPEAENASDDYYRKHLEEITVAVTRGSTGIEAAYFFEQQVLHSLERDSS